MLGESKMKTILVLEDEIPLQNAIETRLRGNGFNVLTVRRVVNGLDVLESEEVIDAIWLDHYLLGKEDGLDFVAKVKENKQWRSIPIFVVSNTASPKKFQTYLKLGVRDYYLKADFKLENIINEIKKTINNNK
jgi:CheY-like chemotaxis protein